jgi:16S rRNA G966 N2-methylase RsmD
VYFYTYVKGGRFEMYSVEICAGAGGQALGLERAGFRHVALVEIDTNACNTLHANRPSWNVIQGDVKAQFADWSTRDDIKNQHNMDLTKLLYKNGYPPQWDGAVFERVLEQAENFKKWAKA